MTVQTHGDKYLNRCILLMTYVMCDRLSWLTISVYGIHYALCHYHIVLWHNCKVTDLTSSNLGVKFKTLGKLFSIHTILILKQYDNGQRIDALCSRCNQHL